jgi:hypothetical protein
MLVPTVCVCQHHQVLYSSNMLGCLRNWHAQMYALLGLAGRSKKTIAVVTVTGTMTTVFLMPCSLGSCTGSSVVWTELSQSMTLTEKRLLTCLTIRRIDLPFYCDRTGTDVPEPVRLCEHFVPKSLSNQYGRSFEKGGYRGLSLSYEDLIKVPKQAPNV